MPPACRVTPRGRLATKLLFAESRRFRRLDYVIERKLIASRGKLCGGTAPAFVSMAADGKLLRHNKYVMLAQMCVRENTSACEEEK